jgi:hypothetical protein
MTSDSLSELAVNEIVCVPRRGVYRVELLVWVKR